MKLLLTLCTALMLSLPALAKRPYTIDDALGLESIGSYYGGAYAFAPDSKALAFTRVRTQATLANLKWEYLWGNAGGDVWLQSSPDAKPANLTRGAKDGSGWWAPQWSPDGKRLAMLSTCGGNVRIWLWNAKHRRPRLISARAVESHEPYPQPFLWIDSQRLIYPALPEGEQPLGMRIELDTPRIASREWPKVPAGKETTASVLDSGVAIDVNQRRHGQLRMIDVTRGSETVVADASTRAWSISPNRKAVAFAQQTSIYTPQAGEPLPLFTRDTYGLGLTTLEGKTIVISGKTGRDILPTSLRWSAAGDQLAYIGWVGDRSEAPVLFRLNLADRRITAQNLGALYAGTLARELPQLEWAPALPQALLVLAYQSKTRSRPVVGDRRDWWLVDKGGDQRNLTADLSAAPEELWPEADRPSFIGFADGELWRVDAAAAKLENLSADFEPKIERMIWPAYDYDGLQEWPVRGRSYSAVTVAVREDDGESYHRIALKDSRSETLKSPDANATLIGHAPDGGDAVFHRTDERGLFLWRKSASHSSTLVSANGFLREIQPAQVQSIDYISLDGQPLKAWLLLPPGYKPGQRYPLLTSVYASYVAGPQLPYSANIGEGGYLNLQIAAARGYAVLKPSMPLAAEGAVADPMLGLMNGVMPAVDKVVAMGIADDQRLYVMGQSYGGFSTYGLVTQTQRFAAAVSLAGVTDLVGMHGAFDARMRYGEHPHENLLQGGIEAGVLLMGGPPWTDLDRYIRNSPLHHVDKVQTPLLIIHGDLDGVPITQSEAFFNSLYRQGKRTRFVRYWGEGHVLRSPANVHDMWQRIFDWFDEFPPKPVE